MKFRRKIAQTGVSWLLLTVLMMVSQPAKLPVIVLIVPFVLLFMALYSTWRLLDTLRGRYFVKNSVQPSTERLGLTVCVSTVLLLVLQSLGQLTLRDVVTVVAIVVLGYSYLARNRFSLFKRLRQP